MQKFYWISARLTDKFGLAICFSCLLLLIIGLYTYYVFLPAQQQLKLLQQRSLLLPVTQQIVLTNESPSNAFFATMPLIDQLTSSIERLFSIADMQHIVINEVVYKDEQRSGETLLRYTISFSVVASYPVIKAFVIESLAALPHLALEQLTFERDELDINANLVSANLRFTLYWVR